MKRVADSFADLELPNGHKRIVQGLVMTHFQNKNKKPAKLEESGDIGADIVRGKGSWSQNLLIKLC